MSYPITAKDALKQWDSGKSLFTVEMGGLGPSYEQAIQVLVFELIRDQLGKPLPKPGNTSWGDDTVSRIDKRMGGYNGAMVGGAKNLAFRALRDGWSDMLSSAPPDRLIQVQKNFPTLKGGAK
jgi:hypothetical protein